jgi:hypothetical protein
MDERLQTVNTVSALKWRYNIYEDLKLKFEGKSVKSKKPNPH